MSIGTDKCLHEAESKNGEPPTKVHWQITGRKMELKEVSVIIPCYNCQDLIGETLQSLAEQTHRNFEVVCVNDGSKDETISVLQQWKEKNILDIRIVDKPNGGVSSARNAGIRAAQGKYVLFLDADDLYHSAYLQSLCDAVEQNQVDVAYCWVSRKREILSADGDSLPIVVQTQSEAMRNLLYRMGDVSFCSFLYRKEWLDRENLLFDEKTRRFEDREFNWKYLCHCKTAALVDAQLYYYRVTENSATQSKRMAWSTERLDAVRRVETYMEQLQCPFLEELKSYLFQRVMWSVAKGYAVGGEKALLKRLGKEYDVKSCMRRTAKDSDMMVVIASWLYLIHPMLFYHIVRLKK